MVRSEKAGQKVPDNRPTATDSHDEAKANVNFDVEKAVTYLKSNLYPESQGGCARHVRLAILAGGVNIHPNPVPAKEYGPYLIKHGFMEISKQDYLPVKGDIAVIQSYPDGNPNGHMCMFSGSAWLSDFSQNDMWSGPGYRKNKPPYKLYRWEVK
jgi:hypothetical protein